VTILSIQPSLRLFSKRNLCLNSSVSTAVGKGWLRASSTEYSVLRASVAPIRPSVRSAGFCPFSRSVLRVWFHDGEIYEWTFIAEHPGDCYRISDSAVHIHLKDSVLSYSLEIVAAVHFQRRRVPPEAPEVVAAEQIIAGKPTEQ